MVQFQKPKKVYNDRRVYPGGGGPALGPGEGFVPAATASAATGATGNDRRNGRARSVDGRNGNVLSQTCSSMVMLLYTHLYGIDNMFLTCQFCWVGISLY